jgi:hypothetical protein
MVGERSFSPAPLKFHQVFLAVYHCFHSTNYLIWRFKQFLPELLRALLKYLIRLPFQNVTIPKSYASPCRFCKAMYQTYTRKIFTYIWITGPNSVSKFVKHIRAFQTWRCLALLIKEYLSADWPIFFNILRYNKYIIIDLAQPTTFQFLSAGNIYRNTFGFLAIFN